MSGSRMQRALDGRAGAVATTPSTIALGDDARTSIMIRHAGVDASGAPTAADVVLVDERGASYWTLRPLDALTIESGGQRAQLSAAATAGTVRVEIIEERWP